MTSKNKQSDPNAARNQVLQLRINQYEAQAIESWLSGVDSERAASLGKDIAKRIAQRAPFANPGELLRAILDLPEVKVGAPEGNRNAVRKRQGRE